MLSTLRTKVSNFLDKLDVHTLEVLKKSSASMVVKILAMIAGVGVSIFLGRTLGPEGLGVINLANRTASLLLVLALFGMPNVIVKEVAIGFEQKDWQHMGNTIYTALWVNGLLGLAVLAVTLPMVPWLTYSVFNNPDVKYPLYIAFVAIFAQVLSRIYGSGVIGMRKIWQGNLVNATLSLWFVALGLITLRLLGKEINILNTAILFGLGRLMVTLSVGIYWNNIFKHRGKRQLQAKKMLTTARPLLLVATSSIIASSADTIMLGWLTNEKQVGLYSVAARIAMLTSFFLQISNAAISPKIAALYAERRNSELELMVQKVTGGLFWLGLASLIFFFLFGGKILSLWGSEFTAAYWILIILAVGQFINLAAGAVGIILMMTNNEKILGKITVSFLLLNLLLNLIFIYYMGAIGAAIATSITVIGGNITKAYFGYRLTGIIAFNLFSK